MRTLLVSLMLALPAICIGLLIFFMAELKRWADSVRVIRTVEQLDEFKALARRQMYAALVALVCIIGPYVLYWIGYFKDVLRWTDFWLFAVLPSLAVAAVGKLCKPIEQRVQQMPVEDETLRRERDRVVQVWMKEPFPNW